MESPGGNPFKKVFPWPPFEKFDALRGPLEQKQ